MSDEERDKRLADLADWLEINRPEIPPVEPNVPADIRSLLAERDEWKRIAYVETKGNSCAWRARAEKAEAAVQSQDKALREQHDRSLELGREVSRLQAALDRTRP